MPEKFALLRFLCDAEVRLRDAAVTMPDNITPRVVELANEIAAEAVRLRMELGLIAGVPLECKPPNVTQRDIMVRPISAYPPNA